MRFVGEKNFWEGSEWQSDGSLALGKERRETRSSEVYTECGTNTREGREHILGHRKEQWEQRDLSGEKMWKDEAHMDFF